MRGGRRASVGSSSNGARSSPSTFATRSTKPSSTHAPPGSRRVDAVFSTWRPDTEIMRIGRGELRREDAGADVRAVLELCEQMRLESHGAFDIAVGAATGRLQLSRFGASRSLRTRQGLGRRTRGHDVARRGCHELLRQRRRRSRRCRSSGRFCSCMASRAATSMGTRSCRRSARGHRRGRGHIRTLRAG